MSTLVERIAEVEGIDATYASGVARYLREAGLLTQAGRGRGAAHMNITDAARLLIGLNASVTAKEAPDYTRKFGELKMIWDEYAKIGGVCEKGQLLLPAIENLIELCGQQSLRRKFEQADLEIKIQFNLPVPHVFIHIFETTEDEFCIPDTKEVARGMYGSNMAKIPFKMMPDKIVTTTITQRTLLVAADVVAS
ncbi:hypothetical protein [Methylobacterium nigriterrae]|uniref:hypothetical protein n=1 Tax=Methylobacterium nigriterrae TaxID=3127512 RepID=UPI003013E3E0